MNPLVSVVVTTYNLAAYIEEALQSVFAQTYPHMEVIVVDDGSSDDTAARIKRFKDKILYINQENQGVAASRNAGVLRARGELVAFLDGDDVWEPEKLSVQVAAAQRYPGSGLIVVDGVEFWDKGILKPSLIPWSRIKDCFANEDDGIVTGPCYRLLLQGNFICTTSQVMVPASVFGSIGLCDKKLRVSSDYELYLRIAARYDVTVVKKSLVRWRYLSTGISGPRAARPCRWSEATLKVLRKHLWLAPDHFKPLIQCRIRTTLIAAAQSAYYYGREEDKDIATRYLLRLLVRNFPSPVVFSFLGALWCPPRIASMLGPTVRKLLRFAA